MTDERKPELPGTVLIREMRGSVPLVLMSKYLGPSPGQVDAAEVSQKPLSARDLTTSLARVLLL